MCPTANNVPVFSMTSTPAAATAVIGAQNCKSDYLIIRGGSETNFGEADRFCGTSFPQGGAGASLCCKSFICFWVFSSKYWFRYLTITATVPSFNVVYRTDGSEAITEDQNIGFCLNFQQYKWTTLRYLSSKTKASWSYMCCVCGYKISASNV